MVNSPASVERTVVEFLTRLDKLPADFGPETPLYADGADLDSLETAELSATLEDVHGTDPFSGAEMPQTTADILAFYGATAADV